MDKILSFQSVQSYHSLFKGLIENSEITGIFLLDTQGIVLAMNKGVTNWLGYTEQDLIGKSFCKLFTKEDIERKLPERELEEVLETGNSSDENYLVHKLGNYVWVNGESVQVRDGEQIYILKQVFDLRKQKMLEVNLQRKNKDLNNFVYAASHDLKAPIGNLARLIDALEESADEKDTSSLILKMMKESVARFNNTLNDLSQLGKLENTEYAEDLCSISFAEMLEDVRLDLISQIEETGTVIKADFSQFPEIIFSRKNLRSLLYNLLSNSIKYRFPERNPLINISTQFYDSAILLIVEDNGIGISEEIKEKLFSLYERFQHEGIPGTGVGLAIVKNIVDNCGGRIELRSVQGSGSTFIIHFPKDNSFI